MSTWAFSDIHGNRKLFDAIKNFIKEDDTIYFLGDACDRGPDGWEIIKEILADERFIYLKGNHEDMLVKAFFEQMKEDRKSCREYCNKNGEFIYMSHAGYSMGIDPPTDEELIWDRTHFLDTRWFGPDNAIVIHGHTPIPHLVEFPPLEDLPNPGIKQYLLHCQMDSLPLGHQESHRQSLQVFIILCSRPGPQVSTASHAGNHLGPFSPVKLKMIQHHPTWSRISQGSPNIPQNHNNKMAAKVTVLECPVIQQ